MLYKNTASQKAIYYAFDATTGLPKTGDAANITPYESLDYGAVTAITDTSMTEMDATNAKGYYICDLTQGETNANRILFTGKSSTANVVVIGAPAMVWTQPTGFQSQVAQTGDNYARLGAPAGASVSADIAAVKTVDDAIKAKTDNLPAAPASTTNITAGTITTVTNLTNAPSAGDFTATMKTSIGTAVAASAVASVTGNVGGNVVGSVASVAAITASGGIVSADIKKVNAVTVTGDGTSGTPWGP